MIKYIVKGYSIIPPASLELLSQVKQTTTEPLPASELILF